MEDYAESNRIWHRWLNYTLLWWHRKLLRYRSSWRNSFEVHDALSRKSYTQREFADQDALNAVQEKLGRAGPQARPAILDKFLRKYPAAYSLAQLRVRLDYLKLWKFLIDELRRVPTASEQIKSGIS